jgi:tRNA pseudouridine13 synthase
MDQERRALRLLPRDLAWRWLEETGGAEGGRALEVSFGLPAGAYATTVLRELAR